MAFYRTDNGGANWTTSIVNSTANSIAQAVAINPLNDQVVYVGGYTGSTNALYVSLNGGSSWTQIGAGTFTSSTTIRAIVVDPSQPSRIFVGTSNGLFRTENSGSSWTKTLNYAISGIRIDRNHPENLWASSNYSGMFCSSDRGGSWTAVNDGLETLQINGLDLSTASGMVYAATPNGGVFRRTASSQSFLTIAATAGGTTNPAPGTYAHAVGAVVTVSAIPQTHFRFLGWTGDASGTASPITLTMTTDKSVTANFQRIIYAPANFAGEKKVNRGVLVSQFINVLTWQAHPNNANISKYRIYLQSGSAWELRAEVDSATFEYRDKNVAKDGAYTYMIKAVNNEPREGDSATVTVR